jgi:hypothetical protein
MIRRCLFIAIGVLAGSATAQAQVSAPFAASGGGSLPYNSVVPAIASANQPPAPFVAPRQPPAVVRPSVDPIVPPISPAIPASATAPLTTTAAGTTVFAEPHPQALHYGSTYVAPTAPAVPVSDRLTESSWYTRADYFRWKERLDGADFVTEDGVLWTLGYVRRVGPERFRGELFGNSVDYSGGAQSLSGSVIPLESHTNYLGIRGEIDLLLEPDMWPAVTFVGGIGTRFWFRELPDVTLPSGATVFGYEETWWTIYPYIGIETTRVPDSGPELYAAGRVGFTAITHEQANALHVVLYPKLGAVALVEAGIRGQNFFLSAVAETMKWNESDESRGWLQPASRMITVGLKTGVTF